jgi:hypothetical protein
MARFVVELSGWHWSLQGRKASEREQVEDAQIHHRRVEKYQSKQVSTSDADGLVTLLQILRLQQIRHG